MDYHWELKMIELLDEIHPGEVLLEDFMKPMGISRRQLAADIDVSPSLISELVNGTRPIIADTALRWECFFRWKHVSGSTCRLSTICASPVEPSAKKSHPEFVFSGRLLHNCIFLLTSQASR